MKAPFRILGLVGLLASPLISHAALQNGKVEFGFIKGKSVLINPQSERKPAATGLVFEEGYRVETAVGTTSELVLSNGATLVLDTDTSLEVRTFRQVGNELIKPGQYRLLDKEPSPSVTEIVIKRGKITGEVRKLNPQSTFTIKTPVGVARIRGTVFTVEYSQNNRKGTGNIKVAVVRGVVEVTVNGSNNGPSSVQPGRQMSAQAAVDISGETIDKLNTLQHVKGGSGRFTLKAAVADSNQLPRSENITSVSVGDLVTGPGIPPGTKIVAIDSEGNITLSNRITTPEGAEISITTSAAAESARVSVDISDSNRVPGSALTLNNEAAITENTVNQNKLKNVDNVMALSVGDTVSGPGIPPGVTVVAIDADGTVILSRSITVTAGTVVQVVPPPPSNFSFPVTIEIFKLPPSVVDKITQELKGEGPKDKGGDNGGGGGGGGDNPPVGGDIPPDDGGAPTKDPTTDPTKDLIDKITDIIDRQAENPSPAGG
ncbi:MAG: FecR family protein [bacterium]